MADRQGVEVVQWLEHCPSKHGSGYESHLSPHGDVSYSHVGVEDKFYTKQIFLPKEIARLFYLNESLLLLSNKSKKYKAKFSRVVKPTIRQMAC